jgi:hypothetical protein
MTAFESWLVLQRRTAFFRGWIIMELIAKGRPRWRSSVERELLARSVGLGGSPRPSDLRIRSPGGAASPPTEPRGDDDDAENTGDEPSFGSAGLADARM